MGPLRPRAGLPPVGTDNVSCSPIVFRSRFSPTAKSNPRAHRLAIVGAALVSALVTSTSATVVFVPRPSGADQISDLKARAAAVSQQLVQQQLQVGAYQQQYSVASAKVAADAGAVAQVDQQIAQDQRQINVRMGDVRQQAIRSYMNYGTGSSGSAASLFSGDEDKVQATSEYTGIATGNITTAVDQLQTAQQALRSDQSVLQEQQAQDLSDQNSEGADLGRATGTQRQMEQLQAQVTGSWPPRWHNKLRPRRRRRLPRYELPRRRRPRRHRRPVRLQHRWRRPDRMARSPLAHPGVGRCRPRTQPVPPVRGAGRIRRQLRGGLTQRPLHGGLPVQPGHLEHGRAGGRPSRSGGRASEPGLQGRPGHGGGRPLRPRRPTAVAGRSLQLLAHRNRHRPLPAHSSHSGAWPVAWARQ